ncbi:MAG: hypothetical protein ACLFPG_04485 [Desulfohalobiaceae bacterium]
MEISVSLMRQLDTVDPDLRQVLYSILEEIERQSQERVTKDEFRELKEIVQNLAQAQARTEARIDTLSQRMEELAQAQTRTEARVNTLSQRIEELAQAQVRTEARVDTLSQRMEELAQAQARTEARVNTLSQRMEELAQAQAKTEAEVRKLAKSHQQLQKQVGGLSDSVGYGIEDRLMPFIPEYARLEFGLQVDYLDRRNIEYPSGKYDEINILASGRINGGTAHLIAECKAKPGKKDADRFASMLERLADVLDGRFFPLLIGYTFAPEVERYIARKYPHIFLVKTYALEMRARGIAPGA